MVIVGSLAAMGLSAVFLFACVAKLRNLPATRSGFVALRLSGRLVLPVIVAELTTALLLLGGPRIGAVMAVFLLTSFTAALVRARQGMETTSVSPIRCNCFGSSSEVTLWTFVRNAMLLGAALLVFPVIRLHFSGPALLAGGAAAAGVEVLHQVGRIWRTTGSLFPGIPASGSRIQIDVLS